MKLMIVYDEVRDDNLWVRNFDGRRFDKYVELTKCCRFHRVEYISPLELIHMLNEESINVENTIFTYAYYGDRCKKCSD